ncbi:MAG: helix-turn-helix transcriptional regulator [Myxococcaceae bacterium]|nr:helix-turn-helix transcriptional regulator [Myxococcaceae bacterium]
MLNQKEYRIALASAGLTQVRLAQKLGVAPSTLSGWVTGAATPPEGWLDRLELALELPQGALRVLSPSGPEVSP